VVQTGGGEKAGKVEGRTGGGAGGGAPEAGADAGARAGAQPRTAEDQDRSRDFRRYPPDETQAQDDTHTSETPQTEAKNVIPTLGQMIEGIGEAFGNIRHEKKRQYAAAMALLGTSVRACEAVGVNRGTPYTAQWREDTELQAALAVAQEMYGQVLEAEIDRRAVQGIWKPTGWYQGEPGGYIREYSDLLLIFRAKGLMPDKYKDRVELRGGLSLIDYSRLRDDQLARIAAGEHPLAVLSSEPVRARIAGPADPGAPTDKEGDRS
jgi:hypothetical protein